MSVLIFYLNSDGQMIAIRLSKQVQKATAAVKKGVQLYNAVGGMKSGSLLHQTITEKDALIPSSAIFISILENQQVSQFPQLLYLIYCY
jgi:hypothetical protein